MSSFYPVSELADRLGASMLRAPGPLERVPNSLSQKLEGNFSAAASNLSPRHRVIAAADRGSGTSHQLKLGNQAKFQFLP